MGIIEGKVEFLGSLFGNISYVNDASIEKEPTYMIFSDRNGS